MSALTSSTAMPSTPGALPALMLMIGFLISALVKAVKGPEGISSITSVLLSTSATCSGLGLLTAALPQSVLSISGVPPLLKSTACRPCSLPCQFSQGTRCIASLWLRTHLPFARALQRTSSASWAMLLSHLSCPFAYFSSLLNLSSCIPPATSP